MFIGSVTYTTTHVSPSTTIHNTNTYEIGMLAYTLSFLHTRIRVRTLSHGFVAHTRASKPIQEHIPQPMECTHKDPPMHTHICLNEGFGLGNSFSRNKNNCQKEKNRARGTAQIDASAYLHAHCGACQSGFPSQLHLSQLSTCWVCFPKCKRLVNLTEISGLHVYGHMSN